MDEEKFTNNYSSEDKKNLRLFIFCGVTIVIIIAIIVAIFIITRILEGRDEPEEYITYENRSIIVSNLDTNPANEVTDHIEAVVMSEEEKKSAPEKNKSVSSSYRVYTTTFLEDTFKKDNTKPNYTYAFDIKVSDGRTYSVTAYEDIAYGSYYLGTIIHRTDKTTKDYVFYDYNEGVLYFDEEVNYKEILDSWVKNYTLNNPVYDISDLIRNER